MERGGEQLRGRDGPYRGGRGRGVPAGAGMGVACRWGERGGCAQARAHPLALPPVAAARRGEVLAAQAAPLSLMVGSWRAAALVGASPSPVP